MSRVVTIVKYCFHLKEAKGKNSDMATILPAENTLLCKNSFYTIQYKSNEHFLNVELSVELTANFSTFRNSIKK